MSLLVYWFPSLFQYWICCIFMCKCLTLQMHLWKNCVQFLPLEYHKSTCHVWLWGFNSGMKRYLMCTNYLVTLHNLTAFIRVLNIQQQKQSSLIGTLQKWIKCEPFSTWKSTILSGDTSGVSKSHFLFFYCNHASYIFWHLFKCGFPIQWLFSTLWFY